MKITFPKITKLTIAPPRTIQVPATTMPVKEIDLTKVKWLDDPTGQTLTVKLPGWQDLQVMGAGTATPYNDAWMDADAQWALLKQLGVVVDANGVGSVAPTVSPAPAA